MHKPIWQQSTLASPAHRCGGPVPARGAP